MKILIGAVAVVALWSVWGLFASRVEQAEYLVLKKENGYEIRQYSAHIVAQTRIEGPYDSALNKGFSIIAGYIFGANIKQEKISMTAPVVAQTQASEKISMTAPVVAKTDGNTHIISFVMPKSYTLESLPVPRDARVELAGVPSKKMAVLRFSWFRSTDRIQQMEKKLLERLKADGVEVVGSPAYAGYNAPGTPPWMMRNEILVEVK